MRAWLFIRQRLPFTEHRLIPGVDDEPQWPDTNAEGIVTRNRLQEAEGYEKDPLIEPPSEARDTDPWGITT